MDVTSECQKGTVFDFHLYMCIYACCLHVNKCKPGPGMVYTYLPV